MPGPAGSGVPEPAGSSVEPAGSGVPEPAGCGVAAPAPAAPAGVRSVGTDAVDLDRFREVLARRPRLAERLFTGEELARAHLRADPVPTLAARFAAKEAVAKALGTGIGAVSWHDIEVGAAPSGAPVLTLTGRAAATAAAAGIDRWHLSLTHSRLVAVAVVVAEGGAAGQDGATMGPTAGSGGSGSASARPPARRLTDGQESPCSRW